MEKNGHVYDFLSLFHQEIEAGLFADVLCSESDSERGKSFLSSIRYVTESSQLGNAEESRLSLATLMTSDANNKIAFPLVMEALPDEALECYTNNIDVDTDPDVFNIVNFQGLHLAALAFKHGKFKTLTALVKKHPISSLAMVYSASR